MKKALIGLFAALFLTVSVGAFAAATATPQTLSLEGLTADQVKAVESQVREAKSQVSNAKRSLDPDLTMLDKAAELGRIIGSGMVATARELGMAANDFAKSDLGRVVMVVLVWKYMGQDILGVMVGVPFLIVGVTLGLHLVRRASLETVVKEYAMAPVLFGLFTVKRVIKDQRTKRGSLSESEQFQQIAGYICIVASVIIGMCTIF
jgi:hypothetical protein